MDRGLDSMALLLERKNIGRLVTGGRRQLGDARGEIERDARLSATPAYRTRYRLSYIYMPVYPSNKPSEFFLSSSKIPSATWELTPTVLPGNSMTFQIRKSHWVLPII